MEPRIYALISRLFPAKLFQVVQKLIVQGGYKFLTPRTFLGFAFFTSVAAALVSYVIASIITTDPAIRVVAPLFVFITFSVVFYLALVTKAEARAREIEVYLPYSLQLISSNIRAGLTLENALWGSARPEFGMLSLEIQRVSRDVFTGMPISLALTRMTERVHSPMLERAVKLIVQGIALGGEMASLLDYVAEDIHNIQMLQREIATSTITYSIFIVFAAVLASPMLFAVSVYYAELNESTFKKRASTTIDQSAAQSAGFGAIPLAGLGNTSQPISTEEIRNFALASITVTTAASAFILGLMRQGKATAGLPYVPVFLFVGLGLFLFTLSALKQAFSALVG